MQNQQKIILWDLVFLFVCALAVGFLSTFFVCIKDGGLNSSNFFKSGIKLSALYLVGVTIVPIGLNVYRHMKFRRQNSHKKKDLEV